MYAWIITEDNLYHPEHSISDEAGKSGPRGADATLINGLGDPMSDIYRKAYEFRMYDDDGILYYTGRLAVKGLKTEDPGEYVLMAPLYDFAGPSAGATLIKYTNHPEWDIEY
jgi:hypothetical protein